MIVLSLLHVVSNSLWLLLLSGSFQGLLSETLLTVFALGTLAYSFYSWLSILGFESKKGLHGLIINSLVAVVLFSQISWTNELGGLTWQFGLVFIYVQCTTTYFGAKILLKSLLQNIGKLQRVALVVSSIVFIFLPIILVYFQHFATQYVLLNLGFFFFSFAYIKQKRFNELQNKISPLTSEQKQLLKNYPQLSKNPIFGLSSKSRQIQLYKQQIIECLERNKQLELESKAKTKVIEQYERRSENTVESILSEYDLTPRQLETVQLLIEGKTTKEIADQLFIESSSVRCHFSAVYRKTGVHGRKNLSKFIKSQLDDN